MLHDKPSYEKHLPAIDAQAAKALKKPKPKMLNGHGGAMDSVAAEDAQPATLSEDAFALAYLERHHDCIYIAPWHRWFRWDGKVWREDSTGMVYARIRTLIRDTTGGDKAEVKTANAGFVSGVERLLRVDQRIVKLPEHLDADPWLLNTQSGIVDLRSGVVGSHDKDKFCTRITTAGVAKAQGAELWQGFLDGVTQKNAALAAYLQRVAGYFATGVCREDVLVYLFGVGSNGKSTFAETITHVLGSYAKVFSAEVLMQSKGERHPTDLAQFLGVRFALTSEPESGATWNDGRVKALTGDAEISARFMRADFFTFARTHKTMILGNHMPRLNDTTHAMRRRLQMVPFRCIFTPDPDGPVMRERLKAEAGGAVLAWLIDGAMHWQDQGTAPPPPVLEMTSEYLTDQDVWAQWMAEKCVREGKASELLSKLHKNYKAWCEAQDFKPKSNLELSAYLRSAGFEKKHTVIGNMFEGLKLKGES
jgi:putative DNA primase/helicase